jgi:ribonuclease HI
LKILDENALVIYTDGSCLPKPRRGGYGIRFLFPSKLNLPESKIDYPSISYTNATNNAMELLAVISALEYFDSLNIKNDIQRIIIYTDSKYVSNNYRTAMYTWQKSKWFLGNGAPVANAELWKKFVKLFSRLRKRIDIEWVKGHSINHNNIAVDRIAKSSAKQALKKKFKVVNVRRKKTPSKVKYGSVNPSGQRLVIRIITSEFLHVQKMSKYQYEVLSPRSKYYQFNDVLFTRCNMKAGHSYLVSFKKNQAIATISKVIKEITN